MSEIMEEVERHRLGRRLEKATRGLDDAPYPLVVIDLEAFDANADDLVRRADGKPVRVASKSLRVPALLERALARPGFRGVLAYQLREALWLCAHLGPKGLADDIVMGYPSVDRTALARLAADAAARAAVTLMVDDVAQLDLLPRTTDQEVRVAIDVDAGLRLRNQHIGPKRSPLFETADVVALARKIVDRPGVRLVGVMTYEGQVAGVQDALPGPKSLIVRKLKQTSIAQLAERRAAVGAALAELTELEFWNAGGSGSVESTVADPVVTEVAAGSGLLVPALFDHYESFRPRPAAFFAVPVVRRPTSEIATVAGGGFSASGAAGKDRLPLPWAPPGLQLTTLEGAGEVQTPLAGPGAHRLGIGDLVWFRHAKSGELAEHANTVHLVSGEEVTASVPTYRGLGHAW